MKSPPSSPSTRGIGVRRNVVANRTVVEQGIKISWHPHPTICLLRWWVSEWESTSIRRECLLESCLGLWKRGRNAQEKYPRVWAQWSPMKDKSCHRAREEWFVYSTRQFFKKIAIRWKNSSILNDEAITTSFNVRVKRKSEKQRQIQWTNING